MFSFQTKRVAQICVASMSALLMGYSAVACSPQAPPVSGIRKGAGLFRKRVVFKTPMTSITNITVIGKEGNKLGVCDQLGCRIVALDDGKLISTIRFPSSSLYSQLVRFSESSGGMILCRGGGFSDIMLLNSSGNLIWRRGGGGSVARNSHNWAEVNELGHEQSMEFYIARRKGIVCLNSQGRTLWETGLGSWYEHLGVYHSPLKKTPEIVGLTQDNMLHFFFPDGTLIRTLKSPRPMISFRFVKWPLGEQRPRFVAATLNSSIISSMDKS